MLNGNVNSLPIGGDFNRFGVKKVGALTIVPRVVAGVGEAEMWSVFISYGGNVIAQAAGLTPREAEERALAALVRHWPGMADMLKGYEWN